MRLWISGCSRHERPDRRSLMAQRVRSMQLELATTPVAVYEAKFEENGGIVEERIVGEELRSRVSNSEYSRTGT